MKKFLVTLSILLFSSTLFAPTICQATVGESVSPKIYIQEKDDEGNSMAKILPTVTEKEGYSIAQPKKVLDDIIVGIINQISNVFIGFSVLFIIVAGIQYVLAQGDEDKIKKAHKSILWSAVGVILVMLSYTIIYVINTLFTVK